jgi:hypothetical protein
MPKLSELASVTTPVGTEFVPVVQGGATKSITLDEIATHTNTTNPATTVSASDPTGGADGDIWYKI